MKKILLLSDYGPNCMTGYATVSRNMIQRLKKHFGDKLRIDIVAINYYGEPYQEYDGTVNVLSGKQSQEVLMQDRHFNEGHDFGLIVFLQLYLKNFYDGVFIYQDLGTVVPMMANVRDIDHLKFMICRCKHESELAEVHKVYYDKDPHFLQATFDAMQKMDKSTPKHSPPWMIYFPVDGPLHTRAINKDFEADAYRKLPVERREFYNPVISQLDELDYFRVYVTFTEYGRRQVEKQKITRRETLPYALRVIPHGINTSDFYPLDANKRAAFRNSYFGKHAGKYIVGVVNRNQQRKDIPTAILGFSHLKTIWDKSLPAPFLYLHMNPDDHKGWKLRQVIGLTDLVEGKDFMFSKDGDENGQVPVETLNKIYNSLDVYVSTAIGGGWELTVTEAMACKVPCILPDHTSLGELGADDRAKLLVELSEICHVDDNNIRLRCLKEEVGEAILETAKNKALTEYRVEQAYEWVQQLNWDNVCEEWINLWNDVYQIE